MKIDIEIIILAAGLGTRMKSDKAKVLHTLLNRPMIMYVMETAKQLAGENIVVVVGHQAQIVKKTVLQEYAAKFALQEKQLGTGHAVQCALPYLSSGERHVVILYGDVPLIRVRTLQAFIEKHIEGGNDLSVLAVEVNQPTGYGRIISDSRGRLTGIVEEADATPDQKNIKIINSGIYCVNKTTLHHTIDQLDANNAQKEMYLTDIVAIGHREGLGMGAIIVADPLELTGINSRHELKQIENIIKSGQSERS
ncbi:MAG: NTP transferase domain-containing protein [Desulfobacteraceae bacterium]|nr:NTP transferase domain-containing protein [Desulfobacteraceae bacterium]